MKCPKCKQYIPNDVRFCPACGVDVNDYNKAELKELTCKSCGGNMEIDYEHHVLVCPYCGATQVLMKNGHILLKKQTEKKEAPVQKTADHAKKVIVPIIRLFAIIIAVIVILSLIIGFATTHKNKHAKYEWPVSGLSTMIPEPASEYGEVYYDYNDAFSMDVYQSSADEFRAYVDACEEAGFTIDAKSDDTSYEAYNEEGYSLRVYLYSYEDEMYINLQAPLKFTTIDWDYIDAFVLLPQPVSDQGIIDWQYEDSASAHIGNTTLEEFHDYVKACQDAGFSRDMAKGDDYYYAYHQDCDQYLSLNYEGFNTMRINVSEYETE